MVFVGPRLSAQVGEGTNLSPHTPLGPGSGSNGNVSKYVSEGSVRQAAPESKVTPRSIKGAPALICGKMSESRFAGSVPSASPPTQSEGGQGGRGGDLLLS